MQRHRAGKPRARPRTPATTMNASRKRSSRRTLTARPPDRRTPAASTIMNASTNGCQLPSSNSSETHDRRQHRQAEATSATGRGCAGRPPMIHRRRAFSSGTGGRLARDLPRGRSGTGSRDRPRAPSVSWCAMMTSSLRTIARDGRAVRQANVLDAPADHAEPPGLPCAIASIASAPRRAAA